WQGNGVDEIGVDSKTGREIIGIDKNYYRPTEVDQLLGNPAKAKEKLRWKAKTNFEDLVKIMIHADWEKVKKREY
ncbi:MAG: GDP-mannose 4,6-dehydratase, partial [SAR202 cluster bacterium]|nr:GDP-mannose 4,6-dehydratase [SAR202 cluster bacterium]